MTISALPPPGPPGTGPGLDAFRAAATQGPQVTVTLDGQDLRVLAQGAAGQGPSGRSVAWVQSEGDPTAVFVQALAQAYGGGISAAVARELGLEPAPGRPLESRLVQLAAEMAETGQRALSGVDFLTQLEHSAVHQGAGFRAVLGQLQLPPEALPSVQRQQIDAEMTARFAQATQTGDTPVSAQTAASWLKDTILRLTKTAD